MLDCEMQNWWISSTIYIKRETLCTKQALVETQTDNILMGIILNEINFAEDATND